MEKELLANIKEVQEGGKYLANWYLDHGYILLDIQFATRGVKFNGRENIQNSQMYFVRRNPCYVLGRPDGVDPAPAPPAPTRRSHEENQPAGGDQ